MQETTREESAATAKWTNYFDNNRGLIEQAILNDKSSVPVDYRDMESTDPEWAQSFFNKPRVYLQRGENVVNLQDNITDKKTCLKLEIHNIPQDLVLTPRYVRSHHLNQFYALRGIVKKTTEIRPWLQEACFVCKFCSNMEYVLQEDDLMMEPVACSACEKTGPWKFLEEESIFVDGCKIQLSDTPSDTPPGQQPEVITCLLREHLVNQVKGGEQVVLNGILNVSHRRLGHMKKVEFNKEFIVNSVEHLERTIEDIHLTEARKEEFRAFAGGHDPLKVMSQNFAYGIHGMELPKKAVLLSIVSGNRTVKPGGQVWRGSIHICLAGEPSTGKSQLMEAIQQITPRCVYASGESASATGLSAAAVKDDFGDGGWSLEIGVLGLANGGTTVIDEADKLKKGDMGILHKAMEQQEIEVHKASIHATIPTICNVILALNPKFGKFDDDAGSLVEQLNLPEAIYSRFDSIFLVRDNRTKDEEEAILDAIIDNPEPDVQLTNDWMMEYLSYAKAFTPIIPRPIFKKLKEYYLDMKYKHRAANISIRQFHSLRRLTEAHAKINLREECTVEDLQVAFALYENYMNSIGVDKLTGNWDGGIINGLGSTKSQEERMRAIVGIIKDLSKDSGYAFEDDIIGSATLKGIVESDTEKALQTLKRNNSIYNKGGGSTWALL